MTTIRVVVWVVTAVFLVERWLKKNVPSVDLVNTAMCQALTLYRRKNRKNKFDTWTWGTIQEDVLSSYSEVTHNKLWKDPMLISHKRYWGNIILHFKCWSIFRELVILPSATVEELAPFLKFVPWSDCRMKREGITLYWNAIALPQGIYSSTLKKDRPKAIYSSFVIFQRHCTIQHPPRPWPVEAGSSSSFQQDFHFCTEWYPEVPPMLPRSPSVPEVLPVSPKFFQCSRGPPNARLHPSDSICSCNCLQRKFFTSKKPRERKLIEQHSILSPPTI